MLGIVFTSLVEMLKQKASPEFANEVIADAELEVGGSFKASSNYPYSEMQKLVNVLVEKTGKSADELLHEFGYYLFGRLAQSHGQVLAGKESLLDMLEYLDGDIHVQVRELYPDADLPRFTVISRTDKAMRMRYHSKRDLYALAEGLLDGAANFYNSNITRETIKAGEPHTYDFSIQVTG